MYPRGNSMKTNSKHLKLLLTIACLQHVSISQAMVSQNYYPSSTCLSEHLERPDLPSTIIRNYSAKELNNPEYFKNKRLPVNTAIQYENTHLLEAFIKAGADLSARDSQGSPTLEAAKKGDLDALITLAQHKAPFDKEAIELAMIVIDKHKKRLLWPTSFFPKDSDYKTQEDQIAAVKRFIQSLSSGK